MMLILFLCLCCLVLFTCCELDLFVQMVALTISYLACKTTKQERGVEFFRFSYDLFGKSLIINRIINALILTNVKETMKRVTQYLSRLTYYNIY